MRLNNKIITYIEECHIFVYEEPQIDLFLHFKNFTNKSYQI